MRVKEIIARLQRMDQETGQLIPNPDILEATGCEDIDIEVLDSESASLELKSCSEKLRNPNYFIGRSPFRKEENL